MSSQLLIETAGRVTVLVAALGIATCAKALALVLRTWIEQASRTRRLTKALENSRPNQRPEIIVACSQLEGRPAGKPGGDTADGALPAHGHPQPPALILQNKRGHERHRD
jgi:hypothetical protein